MKKNENGKYINEWVENAKMVAEDGGVVNWEERYYECPICGEIIAEEDYAPEELEDYICPVCMDEDDDWYWDEDDEDDEDEDDEDEDEDDEDEDDAPMTPEQTLMELIRMARSLPGCVGVGIIGI